MKLVIISQSSTTDFHGSSALFRFALDPVTEYGTIVPSSSQKEKRDKFKSADALIYTPGYTDIPKPLLDGYSMAASISYGNAKEAIRFVRELSWIKRAIKEGTPVILLGDSAVLIGRNLGIKFFQRTMASYRTKGAVVVPGQKRIQPTEAPFFLERDYIIDNNLGEGNTSMMIRKIKPPSIYDRPIAGTCTRPEEGIYLEPVIIQNDKYKVLIIKSTPTEQFRGSFGIHQNYKQTFHDIIKNFLLRHVH